MHVFVRGKDRESGLEERDARERQREWSGREGCKRDMDSEHQEEERRVGAEFKADVDPLALAPTDAARFNVADGGIGDVFEL